MSRASNQIPLTALDAKAELARRAKIELEKRRMTPDFKEGVIKSLRAELFPQQLQVLDDPRSRIALCCSRRAGKSELCARIIAITLLKAGHNHSVLFSARTLAKARQIIWPILAKINDDYGLGWRMSEHIGQITTPDGAVMVLLGVDDAVSVEKVRGGKFVLAVCDESATYEALLQRLVVDCIGPGTMDFKPRGRIILAGTPGYAQAGYWYDVATGRKPGWKSHFWTLRNNPHIPDVEASLAQVREENGWDESDPTYRREYLGQWVADESTLVYPVAEGRNTCSLADLPQPPPGKTWEQWVRESWSVTVGADIGFVDSFAIVALGSPPNSKDCYFLESASQDKLLAQEQAAFIQRFRERYAPERTVIDAGGAGKLVHQEFNSRYGQMAGGAAAAAQKMGKNEAIGMFGSDMRIGRIKAVLPTAVGLYREWCELVWADDDKTKVNKHQAKNHTTDAALYAWRAHRAYLAKAAPVAKTTLELEDEASARRLQKAARARRGD